MSKHHKTHQVTFTISTDIDTLPDTMHILEDYVGISKISKAVANELIGKTYSNWKEAKRSLMKAIYRNHSNSFVASNTDKARGNSPRVNDAQSVGKRVRFEVHHLLEVSNNLDSIGDIANLVIVSPKQHDILHSI